jgi:hypothetical protein
LDATAAGNFEIFTDPHGKEKRHVGEQLETSTQWVLRRE